MSWLLLWFFIIFLLPSKGEWLFETFLGLGFGKIFIKLYLKRQHLVTTPYWSNNILWIKYFRSMLYAVIQARGTNKKKTVRKVNISPRRSRGQIRNFEDNIVQFNLQGTEFAIIILNNLGWQVLQYIFFQPSQQKRKNLSVKCFHCQRPYKKTKQMNPFSPSQLSTPNLSLHSTYKITHLQMRKWETIKKSKLLQIETEILFNLFNQKYGLQLGEFHNTTGTKRVKVWMPSWPLCWLRYSLVDTMTIKHLLLSFEQWPGKATIALFLNHHHHQFYFKLRKNNYN